MIDDKGAVHYRKVLIEARGKENIERPRFKRHLKKHPDINLRRGDTTTYVGIDKSEKVNWKSNWYNFPLLSRIVNAVSGKPLFSKGIISHRGIFNSEYTDAAGKVHKSNVGVTTLYELEEDGQSIRKHDPWAPIWSIIRIPFPRSRTKGFVAKKLDASSSTLFTIGYELDMTTRKKETEDPN